MKYKLIVFYGNGCLPCNIQKPIIRKLKSKLDIQIDELNAHENLELVEKYNISSVPTLVLVEDDKEIKTWNGLTSKEVLEKEINENML